MAKNCGSCIHDEISTQDFMNQMKTLVKVLQFRTYFSYDNCNRQEKDPVRSKSLELIQVWSHAFRHQSKYSIVQSTYNSLKTQGDFIRFHREFIARCVSQDPCSRLWWRATPCFCPRRHRNGRTPTAAIAARSHSRL